MLKIFAILSVRLYMPNMKMPSAHFFSLLLLMSLLNACSAPSARYESTLSEGWTFRQIAPQQTDWQPATIPGDVMTDLAAQGLIPDPLYGFNEQQVQWVSEADWEYRHIFQATDEVLAFEEIELVFEGLDTYAEVLLNGQPVLSADNMFRKWAISCKMQLKPGSNELIVRLNSPIRKGMQKLQAAASLVPAHNEQAPTDQRTSPFSRKAPYHYGWDWGPRLVTSGIWRPVVLSAWSQARLSHTGLFLQNLSAEAASYQAAVTIQALQPANVEVGLQIDGREVARQPVKVLPGNNTAQIDFKIEKPILWWPNGLGAQHLYRAEVLLYAAGRPIDRSSTSVGVRTVEVVNQPDKDGESFFLKVNGVPVFMKGANYIPTDNLPGAFRPEKYEAVIRAAAQANMNMLRVWGGAIYENDLFYELCDQYGLLVWQDFMFACSMVPSEEAHLENIRKEAEENVIRLRNHPSVALWCGNNENLMAWNHWSWQKIYGLSEADSARLFQTYIKVFHEILPEAVEKYSPGTFYWPSSSNGDRSYVLNEKQGYGDLHDWTVWFRSDPIENYRKTTSRFMSEYGMQSLPDIATLKAVAPEGELAPQSAFMRFRQRSPMDWKGPGYNGNDHIRFYMQQRYPVPAQFEDYIYISQLSQAEGMRAAIEAHRSAMPYCMGTLYWQINDCWPTVSWASLDYYFRPKASHYFISKAFEPLIVSAWQEGNQLTAKVVSDRLESTPLQLSVRILTFSGEELYRHQESVVAESNTATQVFSKAIAELGVTPANRPACVAVFTLTNQEGNVQAENLHFFEIPSRMALPTPEISVSVASHSDGEWEVLLQAKQLAKNVWLNASQEGSFSDNYFDMLPGQEKKVRFRPGQSSGQPLAVTVKSLKDVK